MEFLIYGGFQEYRKGPSYLGTSRSAKVTFSHTETDVAEAELGVAWGWRWAALPGMGLEVGSAAWHPLENISRTYSDLFL